MRLEFTKMQGCGNDYIYLDCRSTGLPPQAGEWAVKLSPRGLAVGADGVICICPPVCPGSDAAMHIFNADGSEAAMCGNGIRCVAQFLREHGVEKDTLRIDTPLDQRTPTKVLKYQGDTCWTVEMGRYSTLPADLPAVNMGSAALVKVPLEVEGQRWQVTCVSTGNPHCVTVVEQDVQQLDLPRIGPCFEHHPNFPKRINTEFCRVLAPDHLQMRVWERGSGETLACGTGTCATVAACVEMGLCPRETLVRVDLRGGTLTIRITAEGMMYMTGPATTVYQGVVEV